MFQFESVYPAGVGWFDIVMIVVIVEFIDDADAKGLAVAKTAKVYAGYIEVIDEAKVAFRFENSVDAYQGFAQEVPFMAVVANTFPECVFPEFIF